MRLFKLLTICLMLASGCFASNLRQVAIIDLPGQPGFDAMAVANGCVIIAHSAADTVDIVDLSKRRMIAQVKHVRGASGIAVDEKNGRVFLSSPQAGLIVVISSSTWDVETTIPTKTAAERILYVPANDRLYIANSHEQSIGYIDLAHGNAIRTEDAAGMPERLVYDAARNRIYATLHDRHSIGVFDLDLNRVTEWTLKASQPTGLVLDPEARKLYVAVRYAIVALYADSGAEINRVGAPAGVDSLWLDTQSTTLYAASGSSVSVLKTGASGLERGTELNVDVRGSSLAFDPRSRLIYLPGGREGRSKLLILKQVDGGPTSQLANKDGKSEAIGR